MRLLGCPVRKRRFFFLLFVYCSILTNAQMIAAWKGSIELPPDKRIRNVDGSIAPRTLVFILTVNGNKTWVADFSINGLGVADSSKNSATQLNLVQLSIPGYSSFTVNVSGRLSPDSSTINCTASIYEGTYTLLLHRLPPPVYWSGDILIKGERVAVSVNYFNGKWEVKVRTNDTRDSPDLVQSGDSLRGEFAEDLFSQDRKFLRLDCKVSPDSNVIAATLLLKDSGKYNLALLRSTAAPGSSFLEPSVGLQLAQKGGTFSFTPLMYWWAGGWLAFGLLLFLFFLIGRRKRAGVPIAGLPLETENWLPKVLPIVRISIPVFFGRRKVLLVGNDALYVFSKRKKTNIDVLHDEGFQEEIGKTTGIGNVKTIPLKSVKRIAVEKETKFGIVRFRIYHQGRAERFVLPYYEMPNLLKAFHALVGERLYLAQPIRFHSYSLWIKLFLSSFVSIYAFETYRAVGDGLSDLFGKVLFLLVFLVFAFYSLYLLFSSVAWFMDHLPRQRREKSKKQAIDKSRRQPFRSVPVAVCLRVLGGAILLLTLYGSCQKLLPKSLESEDVSAIFGDGGLPLVGGYLLAGFLLNLSLAFANSNPRLENKDKRPPILYLRSFLDDRETSFQPATRLSTWLGVDPPYYQLKKFYVTDSVYYRFNRLLMRYLYNNHPVRMIRLLLGLPVDTSEQQLELHYRKQGPLTAIGKPGEKIITTGASRMYVTNDEWQDVILDYLHKSQLVVLQPSSTEGVWWEVEQSLAHVEPEHLLLCMVNYKQHQNAYEDFRLRFKALKREITLPRHLGNANEIYFLRFERRWRVQTLPLKYRSPFAWPFVGNAADLKHSLI